MVICVLRVKYKHSVWSQQREHSRTCMHISTLKIDADSGLKVDDVSLSSGEFLPGKMNVSSLATVLGAQYWQGPAPDPS